jgi:large subunit ribosomal protein L9
VFEAKRAELEAAQQARLAQAQAEAAKLDGLMLQITRKTGMDGRLFGSVTHIDIADALKAQGHNVERSAIRLPEGPLKAIGDAAIEIALHSDVVARITVSVLGEH